MEIQGSHSHIVSWGTPVCAEEYMNDIIKSSCETKHPSTGEAVSHVSVGSAALASHHSAHSLLHDGILPCLCSRVEEVLSKSHG